MLLPRAAAAHAQWLACALPCRRFAHILADARARLEAEVGRYSFLVMDLHHLLLAGLPAHSDQVLANTPDAAAPFCTGGRNVGARSRAIEELYQMRRLA